MKKRINKKTLILLSLLLLLPLFSGCFLAPLVNQVPTITSTPITTATVDELYIYNVDATDPDGDTLTYSLTTPTGMTIDSVTGVISWTPTFDQIGDNDVTVEVSDGLLSDSQNFIIIVSEAEGPGYTPPPSNRAPTITSTPITTVTVDELYTYDVDATDPDGDTLTYSLTTPTGMTIDSATGVINWTPNSSQIGDNDVTVEVSDGKKSTTQSFTVKVYDILTSIVVLPETMGFFVGEDDTITSITASYNYGPDASVALAACSYSSDDETVATVATGVVTGVGAGSATITISYTEGGITKTDTVEVTVNPVLLTSIVVLPETMTLFVGEDDTIDSITASYNYGPDKIIALNDPGCSYSSDDVGVATVATGEITGVGAGSATITVSYEEGGITKTDTVAVTVNPIPPNLELTPPTQSVTVGNQATINVEVEDVIDLRGANITLNFDASKLQYISSANGGFIPSATLLEQSIDNTNGTVILDIAGLGASAYASGSGTIMAVVFKRIATGDTNITFGATKLRDKGNNPITHTTGSGCSVTIN